MSQPGRITTSAKSWQINDKQYHHASVGVACAEQVVPQIVIHITGFGPPQHPQKE